MGFFADLLDRVTTPPERDDFDLGPRFDPGKPWFIAGYRSGGGKNKNVAFYGSEDQAASALRRVIKIESDPEKSFGGGSGRYVYKMGVARNQNDLDTLLDRSMSRGEYLQLASKQALVAPVLARRAGCGCKR